MIDRALNSSLQVSFSFAYAAFVFWFWPHFNDFFKNFSNEVIDLIYSGMKHDPGNVFHMFAPKALELLFPNFVVF